MSTSQNPNRRAQSQSSTNKAPRLHETGDSRRIRTSNDEQPIEAYLSNIQRGGHIQPFGFLLAVDEPSFRLVAYSENAEEMLALTPPSVPSLENPEFSTVPSLEILPHLTIGTDVRTLFTSECSALLERAFRTRDITMLNPLQVHSKSSGKPFYAILHRVDVGVVIDLEPARTEDLALSIAGVAQSQKLAAKAISYLQSLPAGDIELLFNGVVQKVRELTGYDRVMVYKFHEDDHGEVLAESKRHDLEPYLGLHYPATDIPQASRFLFKQNKVRMIVDCNAAPVKVIQHEALMQPLCLVGSTLRAPHGCHSQYMANMGSVASLVFAVIINENNEDGRLWGLVVGHHTIERFVPFPLRCACEFFMQAFGLQLKMELKLEAESSEKRILKMQTLLCDMLYRGLPTGIIMQNPSIMDLVKCDGAALYHQDQYCPLGLTPTKSQIDEIVQWLLAFHGDSTGLSTDSLANAGFQGADTLGDAVCGMAVANINSRDFIFWFRSDTAKVIKWGGAKHHPQDRDDGLKMNPRRSFKAFLEDVKGRSFPWENAEMNVIHSLQLILRDFFQSSNGVLNRLEELSCVTREMSRLIETAPAPIFAVGAEGLVNGWNSKAAELIGLSVGEAMGKSLVCDLIHEDSKEIAANLMSNALKGVEKHNVELRLRTFGAQTSKNAVFLVVNACSSKDHTNNVVGVCFVGQDVTDQKVVMDKFVKIQGDYKAIVHSPSPLIPPIFASDETVCCNEWNAAMENLTGYSRVEIVGKMLIGEIFGSFCQLRGSDEATQFKIVLLNAIAGQDTEKFLFSFSDRSGKLVQVFLNASKRVNMEGEIIGAICFLQIPSPESKQDLGVQSQVESRLSKVKEMAYITQQVKIPLSGLRITNSILKGTNLTDDQRQLIETSAACEKQILKIVKDVDLGSIEDGSLELEKAEFTLGSVIDAVVSQVMSPLNERGLKLVQDIPEEVNKLIVYGDQARTQQILAGFLLTMVRHAPSPNGWVELKTSLINQVSRRSIVHTEFRMMCPGEGLPSELVQDIFHNSRWVTEEGLGLGMCRKILKLMNGEVQYTVESQGCYFRILVDLPTQ